MIGKIRKSLTLKIFLITAAILISICFLIYGIIAYFMPKTYTWGLNESVDKNVILLLEELTETRYEDSGPLFDQFILNNPIGGLYLYDSNGEEVRRPGKVEVSQSDGSAADSASVSVTISGEVASASEVTAGDESETQESTGSNTEGTITEEKMSITTEDYMFGADDSYVVNTGTSNQYEVQFKEPNQPYVLAVIANGQEVNQAELAMERILPWLIAGSFLLSMLVSFFYSRYVTKSVVEISRIAGKMSKLNFDWECEEKRTDEIGVLAGSLNVMSKKLSGALGDLKKANAELKQDMEREKRLEQKRLEFFSAVSHELKTPITIMKGQLEGMIYRVGIYQNRDKYLNRSYEVACSMEGMVQEILTVSRMESTGFQLHKEVFDFQEVVRAGMKKLEELFLQKELLPEIETAVCEMNADKKLMQKAVDNVLSNAVHYSPAGSKIRVRVAREGEFCVFLAENTGAHLEESATGRMFEAFFRAEKSRNRNLGGSGLGLYIVKMILEQHGAFFEIYNTTEGVEFSMKMPSS